MAIFRRLGIPACTAVLLISAAASVQLVPPTLANSTPNTSASNADPVEFAGDDLIIVARQDVLDPVATSLRAWALQSDPDFSEVEVDAGTNVLNVYRASDRLDESARAGYAGIAGDVAPDI